MNINNRKFIWCAIALAVCVVGAAFAAKDTKVATHDGKFVRITGSELVMTNEEGAQEHSHTLTADARLTLDGKFCKPTDLKPGMKIRVTTQGADKKTATRIEGLAKNPTFANDTHDGIVVAVAGNTLTMTGMDAYVEHTHVLTADAIVTCDGKACKSSDLKPGMRVRVRLENDDEQAANGVEATRREQGVHEPLSPPCNPLTAATLTAGYRTESVPGRLAALRSISLIPLPHEIYLSMSHRILLVDDDANILAAYARSLRGHFQVDTAQSGRLALLQMAKVGDRAYAVVVTDERMPGMSGTELLAEIRLLSPDTFRIMLTGDSTGVPGRVSENPDPSFTLLMKPCPLAVLKGVVAEGLCAVLSNTSREGRSSRRPASR